MPICPRKYFETTMLVACCDHALGNLDVALLEHHLAALAADHGRADLPFDFVERIDTRFGEEPRERQTGDGWPPPSSRAESSPHRGEAHEPPRFRGFPRFVVRHQRLDGSAILHVTPSAPGARPGIGDRLRPAEGTPCLYGNLLAETTWMRTRFERWDGKPGGSRLSSFVCRFGGQICALVTPLSSV